eukprot:4965487-Amphidinium_carterae.1
MTPAGGLYMHSLESNGLCLLAFIILLCHVRGVEQINAELPMFLWRKAVLALSDFGGHISQTATVLAAFRADGGGASI